MKIIRPAVVSLLLSFCFLLSSCSFSLPVKETKESVLRVGVYSTESSFNPFYASDYNSSLIMPQIFETVLKTSYCDGYEKLCGNITYELLENNKVKYTVSIDDNIRFSNGNYASIDDVIFYYYMLADASYDGPLKDWYLNDIQGLKAYYYDDKNYSSAIEEIKTAYTDPKERKNKTKEYIDNNYADGISVNEISGIKKIDNHTCTIIFNSFNVNSISQINPIIISKDIYGTGYVKGKSDIVKNNTENPVGTGPYCLESSNKDSVTLKSNPYYYGGKNGFDKLSFTDISVKGITPEEAVLSNIVDVCETVASSEIIKKTSTDEVCYTLSESNSYFSLIMNCNNLDINIRKAIVSLMSIPDEVKGYYGDGFTRLFRPISVKFRESPQKTDRPYYPESEEEAVKYLKDSGYIRSGNTLSDSDGNVMTLKICCGFEKDSQHGKVAESLASALLNIGIKTEIEYADNSEYNKSLKNHSADIWIGQVGDETLNDKYNSYYSSSALNYSRITDEEIDSLLKALRSEMDLQNRKQLVKKLLDRVTSLAAEAPLYQLKTITLYNTSVVSRDTVPEETPYGCRYILRELKPVN